MDAATVIHTNPEAMLVLLWAFVAVAFAATVIPAIGYAVRAARQRAREAREWREAQAREAWHLSHVQRGWR